MPDDLHGYPINAYIPDHLLLTTTYRGHQQVIVLEGPYAGWVCYKHPDGQFVTLFDTPLAGMRRELDALKRGDDAP